MNSWELSKKIVDLVKTYGDVLTDEKLAEEINAMIIEYSNNY